MIYDNYIKKISDRFEKRFSEIDPQWNFDMGNEFETELATVIEELLPDKFGVCKGFVTPMEGNSRGDDIIIYDKMNVPLIKPPNTHKFTRKESVPLEATYTYIEAKNTIELKDTTVGTYIGKALNQVSQIKRLERRPRPFAKIIEGFNLENIKFERNIGSPQILNPMYTVLFARGARINGELVTDIKKIKEYLPVDYGEFGPDLIILGPNFGIAPYYVDRNEKSKSYGTYYETPFCIRGRHEMIIYEMPEMAYGFGLCSLLHALQLIKLDSMPWRKVLGEIIVEADKRSMKNRKNTI
ncbi:DUF6602 domain-containing protein [Yeosuana sp.]|mgnify:FL=1|uniref:DUF6602 domain-containing protein n=1 Tax=Yeosuana sp. TaxID=2529388 RepID=UPI004054D841|tara:strand:- start:1633 stop:2523 length:891 start_codon:yes stop_codon:yes gene_type:complete